MSHVIWHCNGVGPYVGHRQTAVAFHAGGISLFEWVPDDLSARDIRDANLELEVLRQRQLHIIARETMQSINGLGVGPAAYVSVVNMPVYRHGMATYNWRPPHEMPEDLASEIDHDLESLRQTQLRLIADVTGGSIHGDDSMHVGDGPYPHDRGQDKPHDGRR